MKTEWTTYLESIGIQGLFLKRVEEVLDFYQHVYPGQIEDIFITDYFDKDGNRQYESMWLFSKTSAMEAKQFLRDDNFDWVLLKQQVRYWAIKKTEYDFRKASIKSRMSLQFSLIMPVGCTLKASQENCEYLKTLFLKYVMPNVMEPAVAAQQMDSGDGQ